MNISIQTQPPPIETSLNKYDNQYDSTYFQDFSQNAEANFQCCLQELEKHITNLISDESGMNLEGETKTERDIIQQEKAKQFFKNESFIIIAKLKGSLESKLDYHILPMAYVQQMIESLKQQLTASYHQIKDEIKLIKEDKSNPIQSKRRGKCKVPKRAILIMKNWLTENYQDPYPSYSEKMRLANESGITPKQVQNWFTNVRGRTWRKTHQQEKFKNQIHDRLKIKTVSRDKEIS